MRLGLFFFGVWSSSQRRESAIKCKNDDVEALVLRRSELRKARDYAAADTILSELSSLGVKCQDKADGSTDWYFLPKEPQPLPNILQVAKAACAAASAVETEDEYQTALKQALDTIRIVLNHPDFKAGFHLPGRRAADAAFHLAMAGSEDEAIFEALANCAEHELRKSQEKLSTRQVLERLAAVNIPSSHPIFFHLAPEYRNFFHPRAQLWRFRYSTTKPARNYKLLLEDQQEAPLHGFHSFFYKNNKRPLIIDIGSGLGASALGLAKSFPDHMVLGLEPLASCLRPARAMARRLGLEHNCVFIQQEAKHMLPIIKQLQVPCALILCQFPTPFAFSSSLDVDQPNNNHYHTHLVRGDNSTRFLLSDDILELIADILNHPFHFLDGKTIAPRGAFYFSSNVEDVAVATLERLNAQPQFSPLSLQEEEEEEDTEKTTSASYTSSSKRRRIPLREQRWAQLAPPNRRAQGPPWLRSSPFPAVTATETEAKLIIERQPIHRLLFTPS